MTSRQWNPGQLLELSGVFWQTCVLHTAVKLDVFTVIGGQRVGVEAVAKKINASMTGVERLLNALAAMQLLDKSAGTYANTPSVRDFLSKDSPKYIGHIILHHHHLMEGWSQLDRAVVSGRPIRDRSSFSTEEWRESFLLGMFNLAMNLAPRLVPSIDLSGKHRLLDLGGGPGTYAIHFCLHHAQLEGTVLDLATTKPFAEKTIKKFDLSDRVRFMAGNYVEDEITGKYDVAWLSHILHGEGPEVCQSIIEKTVSVLEPGGLIIIHEFILDDTLDGPLFPTLFSLNMLLGTSSGRSYSEKQLTEMLTRAGVKNIRRIPVQSPNDSGIIIGER
jgi:hypothetical protein